MELDLRAASPIPEEERAALAVLCRRLRTLQDVVRFGLAQRPPLLIADVIVQDEFTHDVLLPLPSGRVLVFDTT